MEFESIGKAGSRLGTSLAMAVDHEINMVSLVRNLEEFFARESCGWCTPRRDGLPWSVKILRALERGEGQPGDIETLEQLCRFPGPGKTFCAHAPGAVEPLQSAIKYFREEFEAGIKQQFSNTHAINGFSRTCLRRAGNLKGFFIFGSTQMATIHVDGKEYEVNGADNLLEACLSLGLDIPYFCWHPALGSVGACRQCAVKQYQNAEDTRGRLVMSCMTPASGRHLYFYRRQRSEAVPRKRGGVVDD